ncbi:MAG: hypothetical protein WC455_20380 [Dehalococcoidia bacterium]|jgi:hypothetical protein
MRVLSQGHKYIAQNYDNPDNGQPIQFIEKRRSAFDEDNAPMETVNDGTTNEEILAILIDRMQVLQAKVACRENAIVITKLEESLMWLKKRSYERTARAVEGTAAK